MAQRRDAWTNEELRLLQEYYKDHGPAWIGWKTFLPNRSNGAISSKAFELGLHAPQGRIKGNKRRVSRGKSKEVPETCGECDFYFELRKYKSSECGVGKCFEAHTVHIFGKPQDVLARYKAKGLCQYGTKLNEKGDSDEAVE